MTIQLNDVCKYYQKLKHQDTALEFLQQQIPAPVLQQFAREYRNDPASTQPISLVDVAKYYLALPHQIRALNALQQQLPDHLLDEFARCFRGQHAPAIDRSQTSRLIKLDVIHRSQLDNSTQHHGPGYRQCNLTCHTMLLWTISAKFRSQASKYNEPETYYGEILARYGDTTDHDAHTQALLVFGIKSRWVTNGTHEQIRQSLERGVPVVAGVKYRSGGHIILIVGDDPDKQHYLVHDPYGTRIGATDNYQWVSAGHMILTVTRQWVRFCLIRAVGQVLGSE
jgi:hypothetical protein